MKNADIAILMGGHPSEHEISLATGRVLLAAALEAGYAVWPVLVARDGTWNLLSRVASGPPPELPRAVGSALGIADLAGDPLLVSATLKSAGADHALLGLHGRGGEDGRIQGFLETAGIRYTGCGVTASAVAIDKLHFKRLLVGAGLPTPRFEEISVWDAGDDATLARTVDDTARALGLPLAVKAPDLGSSVDVHAVADVEGLRSAVRTVLTSSRRCLVEQWVAGRELTCAVLGPADAPLALPLIEIIPRKAPWFDYASKYEDGGADEIVPAPVPDALAAEVTDLAVRVHRLLDACGVTRTDVMVGEDGRPSILETNTLPGLTEASLVPKAARAAGIALPALVTRLIEGSRSAAPRRSAQAAATG